MKALPPEPEDDPPDIRARFAGLIPAGAGAGRFIALHSLRE